MTSSIVPILEPLSAKPIVSLCESADQQQPASSASPQYTPRLNFEQGENFVIFLTSPQELSAKSFTSPVSCMIYI